MAMLVLVSTISSTYILSFCSFLSPSHAASPLSLQSCSLPLVFFLSAFFPSLCFPFLPPYDALFFCFYKARDSLVLVTVDFNAFKVKCLQHFIAKTVAGEDNEQLFMKRLCFSNSNGHFDLVLVVSQFCNQTLGQIIIGSLNFNFFQIKLKLT